MAFASSVDAESAKATLGHYGSRTWQADDGLPHTIVQAVSQTADGYLWVGTREGLARFNGIGFDSVSLVADGLQPSISSICEDSQGDLWVGTFNSGLYRLSKNRIERFLSSGDLDLTQINALFVDSRGVVWAGTTRCLAKFSGDRFVRGVQQEMPIRSIAETPDHQLIVVSQDVFLLQDDRLVKAAPSGQEVLPVAREAWCDADGSLWIGNRDGLTTISGGRVEFHFKGVGPPGIVSVIFRDSRDVLWIGTYGGLGQWQNSQFSPVTLDTPNAYRIYDLFEDREENLWVASEQGLTRLTPQPFRTYTSDDGLAQNTIVSVLPASRGGVWLGVWGGGVNRLHDGGVDLLRRGDELAAEYSLAICEDRRGALWVGYDYGYGLDCITHGERVHFAMSDGLRGPAVVALAEDQEGNMWVGTRNGLNLIRNGKIAPFSETSRLADSKVNSICAAADGSMLIGTEQGLFRCRDSQIESLAERDSLLSTPILSVFEDSDGTIWLGSKGFGLIRYSLSGCEAFTSRQGAVDDAIYAVLEDDLGYLWLGGSRGICRVKKRLVERSLSRPLSANDFTRFGRDDGILSSGQFQEVTQPAACKTPDGNLWFRTTQGVATVDPRDIQSNRLPPPVVIEAVLADKRSAQIATSLPRADVHRENAGLPNSTDRAEIDIPPGRGELEIRFVALSYQAPEKNRYRYRLLDVDTDWVDGGTQNVANYRNLQPGRYTFQVVASNNDGVWNEDGASIQLNFRPHFWQTVVFKSGVALTVAALLGMVAVVVTRRRMRWKLERLRHQHAVERERARIARDMHDELGAKLTQISFQGATAKRSLGDEHVAANQIERMVGTARDLISSLDEIVWAVDPENDSLENLATYICRYACEFFEDSEIQLRFRIPEQLPSHQVSTEVRHNIFLAYKEALNNAFKHSRATELEVGISVWDEVFEVSVVDNGKGLERGKASCQNGSPTRIGRGLSNMSERLRAVGGIAEIEKAASGGTKVRLIAPLPEGMSIKWSTHPSCAP